MYTYIYECICICRCERSTMGQGRVTHFLSPSPLPTLPLSHPLSFPSTLPLSLSPSLPPTLPPSSLSLSLSMYIYIYTDVSDPLWGKHEVHSVCVRVCVCACTCAGACITIHQSTRSQKSASQEAYHTNGRQL